MNIFVSLIVLMLLASLGWWAYSTVLKAVLLPEPIKVIFTVIGVLFLAGFLLNGLGYANVHSLFYK